MTLTQKLARKYGTEVLTLGSTERKYHDALMHVLDHCKLDLAVDFFKQEIENGTEASRTFCYMWLIQNYGNEPSAAARASGNKRRAALRQRVVELAKPIAEHLDTPGVVRIATMLIPEGENVGAIRAQLRESVLGPKLKLRVTEGDVQQRFNLFELALGLFANDPELIERYQEDLLDPALNNLVLNNLDGRPAHGTFVRGRLFYTLFPYNAFTAVDLNEKQIVREAKLLMKLSDGVVANGDSRLKFSNAVYQGLGGGQSATDFLGAEAFEVDGLFYPYQTWPRVDVVNSMLSPFHKIGLELSDANKKSMFVPKLLALKQFLTEMSDDETQADEMRAAAMFSGMGEGGMRSKVLKDLNYLIKLFDGDSTAKMPKDSMFQPRGGGGLGGGGMF